MDYSEIFYMKSCDETISHIKQLIKSNGLNIPDNRGKTLLCTAIDYKRKDAVNFLIENGADVNQKSGGLYPLEIVSIMADLDFIELLTQSGAVIQEDNHALIISVANRAGGDIVSHLLSVGANPNDVDDDGYTALFWGFQAMDADVVELLLKAGVDPNYLNEYGESYLYQAIADGFEAGVELLIKYGIDVNLSKGATPPLHMATRRFTSSIPRLLEAGVDINARNDDGRTYLFHERIYNNLPLCDYLLKLGADPTIKDNYGYTFLDLDDEVLRKRLYDEYNDEAYF